MELSTTRKGEISVLLSVVLWGAFPVITILSYNTLPIYITFSGSVFFASIFFGITITIQKKWHELKNKSAMKDMFFATIFIGIIFYGLLFTGLEYTSAGNASIVGLSEILISYLFFNVFRKEHISRKHIWGIIFMIIGAIIILFPKDLIFQKGDVLILIGTLFTPIGNYFMQKARKK